MKELQTVDNLHAFMTGDNIALKSVQPIGGDEKFTLITSRYSPNMKIDPQIAKQFIDKNKSQLKKIALNKASTTLYVLI